MLSQKAHGGSDPVPYLRNANVQWRRIDLALVLEMDFTEVELARFDLRPGDLLVCEGGEVGRCAIWEGQLPRCSFQKALHRVRPKDDRLRVEYLQDCLFLLAQRGALVESTSQATIAHLTKVRLEELPLPVPPRSLQEHFVRLYRCARQASRRQAVRFDELDNLFDSLAQRAFSPGRSA
jgi:type I restriction enzyme S subunit